LDGNPIIPKEIKISEKEREKLSIEMNEEIDRELFIK
jgi:hypothetical protein